jgi:hypothetical protein
VHCVNESANDVGGVIGLWGISPVMRKNSAGLIHKRNAHVGAAEIHCKDEIANCVSRSISHSLNSRVEPMDVFPLHPKSALRD